MPENGKPLAAGIERLRARYERSRLSRYLKRGGVLFRDEAGGAVGVRWTRAALTGGSFDAAAQLDEALQAVSVMLCY